MHNMIGIDNQISLNHLIRYSNKLSDFIQDISDNELVVNIELSKD